MYAHYHGHKTVTLVILNLMRLRPLPADAVLLLFITHVERPLSMSHGYAELQPLQGRHPSYVYDASLGLFQILSINCLCEVT